MTSDVRTQAAGGAVAPASHTTQEVTEALLWHLPIPVAHEVLATIQAPSKPWQDTDRALRSTAPAGDGA